MFTEDSSYSACRRMRSEAVQSPCLTLEEERHLIQSAQNGERDALTALVQSHMRLVFKTARSFERASLQSQDLVSEGCIGLIEAIQRFDLTQTTRLMTYAKWWIRARIRAYALGNRNLVRLPSTQNGRIVRARMGITERALAQALGRPPTRTELACAMGVAEYDVAYVAAALASRDVSLTEHPSLQSMEPSDNRPGPEAMLASVEAQSLLSARLHSVVALLKERDRLLVRAHYLQEETVTMADLGDRLGVTRQRVAQIMSRIRGQLRKELEAQAC